MPADELVLRERFVELERLQADAFSPGTFRLSDGRRVIVHNPVHSSGRVSSDLAHELAHIILDHDVRSMERVGNLRFLLVEGLPWASSVSALIEWQTPERTP